MEKFCFSFLLFLFYIINTGDVIPNRPPSSLMMNPAGKETYSVTRLTFQQPDLPVIITNTGTEIKDKPFALLVSGDGGWYKFEQSISNQLALVGIPTVGLNTRKYFWKRKTPEETTRDLVAMVKFYGKIFGKDKYLLIGYSQGAEVIPFVINRLPQSLIQGMVSVILLSPDLTTDFEVHISNMIGIGNRHNTYNVIEEIRKMKHVRTLCILGDKEKSPVPEVLAKSEIHVSFVPGHHHYKGDAVKIVRTIEDNGGL